MSNQWSPICGHCFWDNKHGATAFCEKLGYLSGTLQATRQKYPTDSIIVGKCKEGEKLTACTGGCNTYETGNGYVLCAQSQSVSVSITCAGHGDVISSCGKDNEFQLHRITLYALAFNGI